MLEHVVEVSDAPEELERVRGLARYSADPLAELLGEPWLLDEPRVLQLVSSRRGELTEAAENSQGPERARWIACTALWVLGAPGAQERIAGLAASSRQPARILDFLNWHASDTGARVTEPALRDALLRHLDSNDPAVVKAAIQTCGILDVPGHKARFLALLESDSPVDPERLAFWLSRRRDPRVLALAEALARAAPPDGRDSYLETISNLAQPARGRAASDLPDSSPDLLDAAYTLLVQLIEEGITPKRWQSISHSLAARPLPVGAALMEKLLAESSDRYVRGQCRRGLARLRGDHTSLLTPEAEESLGWPGATTIAELVAGPGREPDDSLARTLIQRAGTMSSWNRYWAFLAALQIGSDAVEGEVMAAARSLSRYERCLLIWRQSQRDVGDAVERLIELGLLPATSRETLEELPDDDDSPLCKLAALASRAGLGFSFDTEEGSVPPPHDGLLRFFAWHSDGEFQPEFLGQNGYQVSFIHHGRAYAVCFDDLRDYYDTVAVARIVNRALADAGCRRRFRGFDTGSQDACFVFGEPGALRQAARELDLPRAAHSGS